MEKWEFKNGVSIFKLRDNESKEAIGYQQMLSMK